MLIVTSQIDPNQQGVDLPLDSGTPSVNEGNYEDYLVDNVEDSETSGFEEDIELNDVPSSYLDELPTSNELLGVPSDTKEVVYPNPISLIRDGMDKQELIAFQYTNRHGKYAGFRTVEPHYTFMAMTTGNEILVTFDRDANDIRAFIVGNIHPNGVRYEGIQFNQRPEIMSGGL